METRFKAKPTAKELFGFKMYHNYHNTSGILTLLLGVIMLGLFAYAVRNSETNISYVLMTGFFGAFFTVGTPITILVKSLKEVKTRKAYTDYVEYIVDEEKITLKQGDVEEKLYWEDVYKLKATKDCLVIYISVNRASIVPLREMKDSAETFFAIAKDKLKGFQLNVNCEKMIEIAKGR